MRGGAQRALAYVAVVTPENQFCQLLWKDGDDIAGFQVGADEDGNEKESS